jgi:ribulose-phosphate 3-epimerase
MTKMILPSIIDLSPNKFSDMLTLFKEVKIQALHVDIMDGHYVPSLGLNDRLVNWLHNQTQFYLDLHLMVDNPETASRALIAAGADGITFHLDSIADSYFLVQLLKNKGVEAGVALNPGEDPRQLIQLLPYLDRVLVMTLSPGRKSIKFLTEMSVKVNWLAKFRADHQFDFAIEVDGGITAATIGSMVVAGADEFVSGSYIVKAPDPRNHINKLKARLNLNDYN